MSAARTEVALTFRIDASRQRVWSLIRRFDEVAAWNPFIVRSSLVLGNAGVVGAEREVVTADGAVVRERLEELDDRNCVLSYRMLTFPLPVTRQINRIVVSPTDRSRIFFSAVFEPVVGALVEEIAAAQEKAFRTAAHGLSLNLGAKLVLVDRFAGDLLTSDGV